jgi:hypothetical protein
MKKTICSGLCIATVFVAAITIAAQTSSTSQTPASQTPGTPGTQATPPPQTPAGPPSQTPTGPPPQNRSDSSDRRITITGCLQPAPASPTGTTGTTDASATGATDAKRDPTAGDAKFLLTNVAQADSSGDPKAAAVRTYRLIANESSLVPHVGKKLELTGTVDEQPSSTRSQSATPSDASGGAAAATAPKLKVESGKVLAPSCS